MATKTDRMFEEVDRQLDEVREQALAIATRAGIVLAGAGIAGTVVSARIQRDVGDYAVALAPLGVALLCAFAALLPTLAVGPADANLAMWMTSLPATTATNAVYTAKLLTLGGNRQRLAIMTWAFYLEVAAVAIAIIVALAVAAGR